MRIPTQLEVQVVCPVPTGRTTTIPQPGVYYQVNGSYGLCVALCAEGFIFAGAVGTSAVFLSRADVQQRPLVELALLPISTL